jgi:hypothetical protein
MDKKLAIQKIAAELNEIRKELRRLAADTSPTKDGAKSLFEAYKKEHPGSKKTVKDFYQPEESGKKKAPKAQKELYDSISPNNPAREDIESAIEGVEGMLKDIVEDIGRLTPTTPGKSTEFEGAYIDAESTDGELRGKKTKDSFVAATSVVNSTFEDSVVGFNNTSKMEAEKSTFKGCKVSISDAYKATFTDSEVVVLSEAKFQDCKFQKGTKIVGDPNMMIFVDGSFDDEDYMMDLQAAGARFVNSDDKEAMDEAEEERDAYRTKLRKKK